VLYHGALSPGRGIEQLVEAADALPPDVAVVFLGDGPLAEELRDRSASAAGRGRIYLHRAVEIEELPGWVAGADVGVIAFQPINRNNYLATPNKLFDYLAGGVPVVVSDFPEMRRIVEGGDAGVCCDPADPASIARGICRLLEAVGPEAEDRRRRIADYAVRTFGWPAQRDALVAVYRRLDGRRPSS
jgi:glycosyltransferase involved in cell wall biosynthesis